MWTHIEDNFYIQGQFLLWWRKEGVGSASWVIGKISNTGITKQWIPSDEKIKESELVQALDWGDGIVQQHAKKILQRNGEGKLRWMPNKAHEADKNRPSEN